ARSVFAADLDNDGDMDIISVSANDDTIAWYENSGSAIPEFSNIMMPIVSVLAIVGFNYKRKS
ncbi:MAG TPA: VCBS repeat-containing protein, partial [Candidatus Thalassarchaeaceae archaeon]|nr:VCBS repeat-containing protein [Candidatus Thalassarchaeaceae archaeon]